MSGKALADMGDDEFVGVFACPSPLEPALAELVNYWLVQITGTGLTSKQGHAVELDMSKVSPEQLMAASNRARARIALPQFPDLTSFDRYQRLRRPKEAPR
jgi:hypothetical protein